MMRGNRASRVRRFMQHGACSICGRPAWDPGHPQPSGLVSSWVWHCPLPRWQGAPSSGPPLPGSVFLNPEFFFRFSEITP